MVALKPCPFCRHDRYAHLCGTGEDYDSSPEFFVACSFCGSNGPLQPTDANAVRLWNTRPPLASDKELRVLQRAANEAYGDVRAYTKSHCARVRVALAASAQRDAATLSALERRLRGVSE